MSESSTPQGTGITEAQAAEAFAAMLDPQEVDSEAGEPLEEETPQAEAEAEDADEADDAEAEDESDESDETDEDSEQPQTFRVKVDGEEIEVTLDELQKGYSREKDYTRKTQAVAEARKAFEAEQQTFQAERERTTNLLKALEENLTAPLYPQEEMDWLRANNQAEWSARMFEQQQRAQQLQAVQEEQERLKSQSEQEQQEAQNRARQEESVKLLALRPEWKDEAKAGAALKEIVDYTDRLGVNREELATVTDHRLVNALWEAAQYRKLMAKTPAVKAKVEAVKAAKPGTSNNVPRKVTDVTRARQRLAKTGREQDAAAVFMNLLPD